jgi:hypothetical protein
MHPLIRITEKYVEAGERLKEVDAMVDKRKKFIIQATATVENRLKDVNRKSTEI